MFFNSSNSNIYVYNIMKMGLLEKILLLESKAFNYDKFQSAKEISAKFKTWISGKDWKKYVKSFSIEPSEKAWLYFNIVLK